jgi:hypothetical protein
MMLCSKQNSKASRVSCVPIPETVTNQHPWLLVSLSSSLGIKHALEPLQANLGVGVPRFGARIVPSRGGERGPFASMGSGWPNNHW